MKKNLSLFIAFFCLLSSSLVLAQERKVNENYQDRFVIHDVGTVYVTLDNLAILRTPSYGSDKWPVPPVSLFDLAQRKFLKYADDAIGKNNSYAISGDETTVISFTTGKKEMVVWDIHTGKIIRKLTSPYPVFRVFSNSDASCFFACHCFSDKKRFILDDLKDHAFGYGNKGTIWSKNSDTPLETLKEATNITFNMAHFPPDEKFFLTLSGNGDISYWDIESYRLIKKVRNSLTRDDETDYALGIFNRNGKYMISCSGPGEFYLIDDGIINTETGEVFFNLGRRTDKPAEYRCFGKVIFDRNGKFFYAGDANVAEKPGQKVDFNDFKKILVWDIEKNKLDKFIDIEDFSGGDCIAVSPNNRFVFATATYGDDKWQIYDAKKKEVCITFRGYADNYTYAMMNDNYACVCQSVNFDGHEMVMYVFELPK